MSGGVFLSLKASQLLAVVLLTARDLLPHTTDTSQSANCRFRLIFIPMYLSKLPPQTPPYIQVSTAQARCPDLERPIIRLDSRHSASKKLDSGKLEVVG